MADTRPQQTPSPPGTARKKARQTACRLALPWPRRKARQSPLQRGPKTANDTAGGHDEFVRQLGELAAQGVQRLVALVQLEGRPVPEKLVEEELPAPLPAAVYRPDLRPLVSRRELGHPVQQIEHVIRQFRLDDD